MLPVEEAIKKTKYYDSIEQFIDFESNEILMDEVWLWAVNSDTSNRKLTIELGGTTSPDDTIEVTIPSESGLVLVVPGLVLNGGVVVRAFSASADVLMISGFVNRIAV